MAGNYDQVRVARAVYEVVADLAVVRLNGGRPSPESFAALARDAAHADARRSTPAGKRLSRRPASRRPCPARW